MEQVKSPNKALFVFVWGVLWGGLTALIITLFDWYTTHRVDSPYHIVGRFVIFTAAGTVLGQLMWNRRKALGARKLTRTGNMVRLILFIGLMLGLSYVLWTMARH
jgi:drug/metabolite transporter (DMT)-like permease